MPNDTLEVTGSGADIDWGDVFKGAAAGAGTGAVVGWGIPGALIGGFLGGGASLLSQNEKAQKAFEAQKAAYPNGIPAGAPGSLSTGNPNPYADPGYTNAAMQEAALAKAQTEWQTRANRPNQFNPYGSLTWTQGPDGQWTQSESMNAPNAATYAALMQNAQSALSNPFSLSGLPNAPDAEAARQQAIDASYKQAASRLNPQWAERERALSSSLRAQGLQPGDAAYNKLMAQAGQERNDAYTSAMNSAIGSGYQTGGQLFSMGQAQRNSALQERMLGRSIPLQELNQFAAGQSPKFSGISRSERSGAPNLLQALSSAYGANLNAANKSEMDKESQQKAFAEALRLLGSYDWGSSSDAGGDAGSFEDWYNSGLPQGG